MKELVKNAALATSIALATLIAVEAAYAQEYLSHEAAYAQNHHAVPETYDTQANPRLGFGPRVPASPNGVMSGNRRIGNDPDPFIRGEILRHSDSGWPD
jgi:hypothetical protein